MKPRRNHRVRGNLLCDWAFMFPNLLHTKLHRCNTHHDYAWCCESLACENGLLESPMPRENFTQLPFCQPAANVHTITTLPSRLRNSIFKFFTHSFAADVESLSEYRREVLNELHFRARVFSFHPLHDATAPPMHWDYLEALTCGNKCSLW